MVSVARQHAAVPAELRPTPSVLLGGLEVQVARLARGGRVRRDREQARTNPRLAFQRGPRDVLSVAQSTRKRSEQFGGRRLGPPQNVFFVVLFVVCFVGSWHVCDDLSDVCHSLCLSCAPGPRPGSPKATGEGLGLPDPPWDPP